MVPETSTYAYNLPIDYILVLIKYLKIGQAVGTLQHWKGICRFQHIFRLKLYLLSLNSFTDIHDSYKKTFIERW